MPWTLCVRTVVTIGMLTMIRTYSEMIRFESFEERFEYLKLQGIVGQSTFGFDRHLNQMLYTSPRWRSIRQKVILRDHSCDLGIDDYEIYDMVVVHHINPITAEDIEEDRDCIYDLNNLVCTTRNTHNAIHFGDASLLPKLPEARTPGDTTPWL